MNTSDLFFHYRNVGSFVFVNKFSSSYFNSYDLLSFLKVVVFFSIKDVDNLEDLSMANYYFFSFFFFGMQCSFSGFTSVFRLGVMYYTLNIQCVFMKKFIYFILNFFINENLDFVILEKKDIY
jgi:hypothetical protein